MRQVSSPVRWGAGRKGRQDLARSLPGFKVLAVLFLASVSQAFLPSKKACWTDKFRHLGVRQQYRLVYLGERSLRACRGVLRLALLYGLRVKPMALATITLIAIRNTIRVQRSTRVAR